VGRLGITFGSPPTAAILTRRLGRIVFLAGLLLSKEGLIPTVPASMIFDEVVGDVECQPDTPCDRDPVGDIGDAQPQEDVDDDVAGDMPIRSV
jgi:hypothetical protein